MLQDLYTTKVNRRLLELVPPYFIGRGLLLAILGAGCLFSAYGHVLGSLARNDTLNDTPLSLALAMIGMMASLLLTCIYLLTVYPLRESFSYPQTTRHPVLIGAITLAFLCTFEIIRQGLDAGANAYLLLALPSIVMGVACGLSWKIAMTMMLIFNVAIERLYFSVEFHYQIFMWLAQIVVFLLFKSVMEEFRGKTILSLNMTELQATQRLLRESVEKDIRNTVARDLHDELGHLATRVSLHLGEYLAKNSPADVQLVEAQQLTRELHRQIRAIAGNWRSENVLDLKATLGILATQIKLPKIAVKFCHFDGCCPAPIAEVIFRACQESITNCLRHSDANELSITVDRQCDYFAISISDNGNAKRHPPATGSGLQGIKDRVQQLRGTMEFAAKSTGFDIQLRLPTSTHGP